jgi:hypothetical protein
MLGLHIRGRSMPTARGVENYEKDTKKLGYNQREMKLLLETVAISEYTKLIHAPTKDTKPKPTFLEWLTVSNVKITNLPDSEQFWIRKQLMLAK